MKNVSAWSFSAPLAKVDIPRILDEAAADGVSLGVVKVTISSPKGASTYVLADSDLAASARMHHGVRIPDAFVANETALERDGSGQAYIRPLISPYSIDARFAVLSGNAIALFAIADGEDADALIAKLVDRVTVDVEVW